MTLYVDFVSPDESIAITTNEASIQYNLNRLDQFNAHYTHICAIGRYICLFVSKDLTINQMLFLDLRKNEEAARDLLQLLQVQQAFRRKFISLMELWNADYENNFHLLELIKGHPQNVN